MSPKYQTKIADLEKTIKVLQNDVEQANDRVRGKEEELAHTQSLLGRMSFLKLEFSDIYHFEGNKAGSLEEEMKKAAEKRRALENDINALKKENHAKVKPHTFRFGVRNLFQYLGRRNRANGI